MRREHALRLRRRASEAQRDQERLEQATAANDVLDLRPALVLGAGSAGTSVAQHRVLDRVGTTLVHLDVQRQELAIARLCARQTRWIAALARLEWKLARRSLQGCLWLDLHGCLRDSGLLFL